MPFETSLHPTVIELGLIVLVTAAALLVVRLTSRLVQRRLNRLALASEHVDRIKTVLQVLYGVGYSLILIAAILMVVHTLGVDVTPLLAGAGVAGLALSLGAQTLIKDYIGGLLILTEAQFTVGDVIKVGEVAGAVERITLRATYLRDLEGKLHLVPNGDIRLISNLTAEWSKALVEFNVEFNADMEAVMRALQAAAERTQADEAVTADLLEPPEAIGWIGLKDWSVQMRLVAKTRPGRQWAVMMALRRHALETLRAEGVGVALPSQKVIRVDPAA